MSHDPLETPEARQHLRDTQVVQRRLTDYLTDPEAWLPEGPVEMPDENDGLPTLRVNPTRANDGRVRMTIPQLAALMGVTVADLIDDATPLIEVLD